MGQVIQELTARPILRKPATTFEELAHVSLQYRELERQPAWLDFMHRLTEMRKTVENEVLRGSLDKFGKDRSDEKRAVHHFLSTILAIAPAIHQDFEMLQAKLEKKVSKREALMGRKIDEHVTNWQTKQ